MGSAMAAVPTCPGTLVRLIDENGNYQLKTTDFDSFADPEGGGFAGFLYTTLAVNAKGALLVNGVDYDPNRFVTAGEIASGQVVWRPNTDLNGLMAFDFRAVATPLSSGNPDPAHTSATCQFNFDVAAVNSAPTIQQDLITNGNFVQQGQGWNMSGNVQYIGVYNGLGYNAGDLTPNGVAWQGTTTVPGERYTLSASTSAGGRGDAGQFLRVSAIDVATGNPIALFQGGAPVSEWKLDQYASNAQVSFTAPGAATRIVIADASTTTNSTDIALNRISMQGLGFSVRSTMMDTSFAWAVASGTQITVGDVDGESGSESLTISVSHGTLTAGAQTGASLVITGTTAEINDKIKALTYAPAPGYVGSDTLVMALNDNGNTGKGGALTANGQIAITVLPVNKVPTLTVASVTGTEDVTLALNALATLADDSANVTLVVSIPTGLAGGGVLQVSTPGAATVTGDGTSRVTLVGAPVDVSAALASMVYVPLPDFNTPVATPVPVTVTLHDDGLASGVQRKDAPALSGGIGAQPPMDWRTRTGKPAIVDAFGTTPDGAMTNLSGAPDVSTTMLLLTHRYINGYPTMDAVETTLTGLVPGQTYTVPLQWQQVTVGSNSGGSLLVTVDGQLFTLQSSGVSDDWQRGDVTFVATDSMTALSMVASATGAVVVASVGSMELSAPIRSTSLTIAAVQDTVDDSITTPFGKAAGFNVLTGDGGAAADSFEDPQRTLTALGAPAHGTVSMQSDGSVVYTPAVGFDGSDSFSYTVLSPQSGISESGQITVLVQAYAPPALSGPLSLSTNEDTPLPVTGLRLGGGSFDQITATATVTNGTLTAGASKSSAKATPAKAATVGGSGSASVTLSGTVADVQAALAALVFQPTADYNGSALLSVSASDGTQAVPHQVSITVVPVQDIANDAAAASRNTSTTIAVMANDSFSNPDRAITAIDSRPLVVGAPVTVSQGSVALLSGGQLEFTPAKDYTGSTSFTYTVTSGGVQETATVSIKVTAAAPSAAQPVPLGGAGWAAALSTLLVTGMGVLRGRRRQSRGS
ncbi:Ig-like domain-containing protein [Diaphorobacter caeni]|uniref:Ig-like domain-containing protein n=1 Tax=Diaphorobacter caeni TaxID=2784387 RepID=UPI001890705D|nr:Ig-like domain-containing protein [Diaphorobacter caeni]MBF5007642.1 tandem-95 repeat protein [Diaphorobacter caeni]